MTLRAAAAVGLAACAPAAGPSIDRVEPPAAARGAQVVVRGAGFCGEGRAAGDGACVTPPPGSVVFGIDPPSARALVVSWAAEAITVTVPAAAPAGGTEVVVTVDGRSSGAAPFEVLP